MAAVARAERTSGIASFDDLLGGGLVLGDNIVWVADAPGMSDPFTTSFLGAGPLGTGPRGTGPAGSSTDVRRRLVRLGQRRAPVPPGTELHDASTTGAARTPEALERLVLAEDLRPGDRLVVDGLDELVLRWGAPATERFYRRTCPRLFDLGVLAYWTGSREVLSPSVIENVTKIAQCVFDLRGDRLRIAKAEGRPAKLQGALVGIDVTGGAPVISGEHAVGRLGEGLRRLRRQRNLTQGELAALAGVTPGAISQAETGRRGLSLDTLVPLCEALGIGVDDLLGSTGPHDHVLVRGERQPAASGATAIFDDPSTGLRAHTVRLGGDGESSPPFAHKGVEVVVVVEGLVLVDLGETTPVMRAGDSLMVTRVPIRRWRNLGQGPAVLLWFAAG